MAVTYYSIDPTGYTIEERLDMLKTVQSHFRTWGVQAVGLKMTASSLWIATAAPVPNQYASKAVEHFGFTATASTSEPA